MIINDKSIIFIYILIKKENYIINKINFQIYKRKHIQKSISISFIFAGLLTNILFEFYSFNVSPFLVILFVFVFY